MLNQLMDFIPVQIGSEEDNVSFDTQVTGVITLRSYPLAH